MTRLLTQEFAQSTSDELVADAAKALKEGAADLEPDLFLLTQADFEGLGSSATARGRKSVLAMQAALLQDAGDLGITEKDMQSLCVDGLNDLNLSDLFMEQAIKLRRHGMAKIYTAPLVGLRWDSATSWRRFMLPLDLVPKPLPRLVLLKDPNPPRVPPLPLSPNPWSPLLLPPHLLLEIRRTSAPCRNVRLCSP